jgi:NADPH:quinone reductase-like Zn-dependent oxidoreductase
LVTEGVLGVPIEGTYPLSRAVEALEALKTQHARGKVALIMRP